MGLADPGDLDDLSWLLAPAPGEPATPSVDQRLSAGRGALRRRRLAVGTATLVALGVVGLGAAAVGATTPGTRSADPAGGPSPTLSTAPTPSEEPPAPDRGADAVPAPPESPDVIGGARTATAAEVREMRRSPGYPVSLSDDGDVILLPGWEVLDRFDDLGSVEALNSMQTPDTVRDAVGVSVAPSGNPDYPTYYFLQMGENGPVGWSEQVPSELDGSIAFWATQKVWAGSPRNNGTPGPDVRLGGDGRVLVDDGVFVSGARSDADLGGLVRADAERTITARVRLPDGQVQFVVFTKGDGYDTTMWFQPEPAPKDIDAFAALVRQVYGEDPL